MYFFFFLSAHMNLLCYCFIYFWYSLVKTVRYLRVEHISTPTTLYTTVQRTFNIYYFTLVNIIIDVLEMHKSKFKYLKLYNIFSLW